MSEFVLLSMAIKLGYTIVAVLCVDALLRWSNYTIASKFSVVVDTIRKEALASAIYYGLRFLAVCLLFGMLLGCSQAQAQTFPSRYDPHIRSAVARWWPDHPDPAAWRAQLYQESRLDPDALSPVGAAGLAQFMPATWRDMARELRLPAGASPHQDIAIDAGAYYMAKLRRQWSAPRPVAERQQLAQASYNAGAGNILRAQALCGAARDWQDIAPCLRMVTGERNAHETRTYIERIGRWRGVMMLQGFQ